MNKTELISAMAEASGLSKADCKKALQAFSASVTQSLRQGDSVAILGFGSFSVAERAARTGVNPATGEHIEIPARQVVKFKPAAGLLV